MKYIPRSSDAADVGVVPTVVAAAGVLTAGAMAAAAAIAVADRIAAVAVAADYSKSTAHSMAANAVDDVIDDDACRRARRGLCRYDELHAPRFALPGSST